MLNDAFSQDVNKIALDDQQTLAALQAERLAQQQLLDDNTRLRAKQAEEAAVAATAERERLMAEEQAATEQLEATIWLSPNSPLCRALQMAIRCLWKALVAPLATMVR